MRQSISLCLLALLFSSQSFPLAASSPLEDLCLFIQASYVDYDFCINTFKADPSSSSANIPELGAIAANLVVANATAIDAKLQQLLKAQQPPDGALEACHRLYSSLIPSLTSAASLIASKRYDGIMDAYTKALEVPAGCNATPINKENTVFSFVANFGQGVATFLVSWRGRSAWPV